MLKFSLAMEETQFTFLQIKKKYKTPAFGMLQFLFYLGSINSNRKNIYVCLLCLINHTR